MFIQRHYPGYLFSAPRSFAALMEVYEDNYIALRRLCPRLPEAGEMRVSHPSGIPRLYLQVLEHTRYTSSLGLTYRFLGEDDGEIESPSLAVRIYHDARQAEVLFAPQGPTHPLPRHAYGLDDTSSGALRMRWSANRFLNRWLHYCIGQGHAFNFAPDALADTLADDLD